MNYYSIYKQRWGVQNKSTGQQQNKTDKTIYSEQETMRVIFMNINWFYLEGVYKYRIHLDYTKLLSGKEQSLKMAVLTIM